ncbi:MAG TPA: hypothetical protein VER98_13700 [Terriglobia bacterium]|nr:hypothetical protein [Terriglobia bacterium]
MRHTVLMLLCVVACLALVLPVLAQEKAGSDPISGTWRGDWGPSRYDRNPVTVALKWDGKALTGTVNPGPNAISIKNGRFDAKANTVHMEADASARGQTFHYVIDGKFENNTLSGSWNHDNRKGDFKITKN